jgi:hypothetical protein
MVMAKRPLIDLADTLRDQPARDDAWSEPEAFEWQPVQRSIGHLTVRTERCPACASNLNRSHVRWWELVYKIYTTKRPYRCSRCQRRAWFDVPPQSATDAGTDAPGIGVRPSGAFIERARTQVRRASARCTFPKPTLSGLFSIDCLRFRKGALKRINRLNNGLAQALKRW